MAFCPFFYIVTMSKKNYYCRSVVIQVLPLNSLVESLFPHFFFTTIHFFCFIAETVTQWGYADAARDPVTNKSFGGHSEFFFLSLNAILCQIVKLYLYTLKVHKLLKRNLPHNFPDDSIYTWFPMSTPTFMQSNKNLPPQPNQPWNFERPV